MSLVQKIKNELDQLGIKPKKSLGQNFLINEGVYRKIIAAAEIQRGDKVIEVGPGLGTLTQFLADAGAKVIAVEKDHHLADYLKTKFANQKNAQPFDEARKNIDLKEPAPLQQKAESRTENLKRLHSLSKFSGARVTILEEDILKFNPANYKPPASPAGRQTTPYKLVGNIPYYLTSHLLRAILESWPVPRMIVLMLQKEVAQRITAKPPHMSMLAVSVQYYARPKIISYVSHGNFYPPPDVDSAIIRLAPRVQGLGSSEKESEKFRTEPYTLNPKPFFRVVRAGFAGKRKQLGNTLAGGLKLAKNIVEEKLKAVDIDPKRRAETLTLDEWQKITNTFSLQD